jgi:mono/diheme cytochrome c family protein
MPNAVRADLIERGRDIFFNETFAGNGRTCATCHRQERNFSIDPSFIATLPDEDPLFVAEFDPALKENFEKPALMRQFGLILENTDGFTDIEDNFSMRSVPHLLALRTSIDSIQGPRIGWSGDGAPATCPPQVQTHAPDRCDDFDGSLRAFALGAVIQHFPKTLDRLPNLDFRLPTDEELDALEAFQLSLGRQTDAELPLPLRNIVASRGQEIFLDRSLGKCNLCHQNAGSNSNFGSSALGNISFNTGVEVLEDQAARLGDEEFPSDDGFGTPGDGSFNTPPLIEAADTGPFFHNNSVETIEGAVAFYNDDAFNSSPAGSQIGGIRLGAAQVVAVAAFLRVLNAIENIDSAIDLLTRDAAETIQRSAFEIDDAIRVLQGGGLHADAVADLQSANSLVARVPKRKSLGRKPSRRAIQHLENARAELIE